jgi:hypothetical protein
MRKEFQIPEPEPFIPEAAQLVERDNLTNIGREYSSIPPSSKIDVPE